MVTFADVLDHFVTELTTLGFNVVNDSFDFDQVAAPKLHKAVVLLPGEGRPSELSSNHIAEEIQLVVAFSGPTAGLEMAKEISANRVALVLYFTNPANVKPADYIQWTGSSVEDWDTGYLVLRLSLIVHYPGLLKPVNT